MGMGADDDEETDGSYVSLDTVERLRPLLGVRDLGSHTAHGSPHPTPLDSVGRPTPGQCLGSHTPGTP